MPILHTLPRAKYRVFNALKPCLSVMKSPTLKKRYLTTVLFALTVVVVIALFTAGRPSAHAVDLRRSVLNCVKIAPEGQTTEGIGSVLRRNQHALFIAETFSAKVAFPNITSDHGYEIQDMFDSCPTPSANCTVYLEDMTIYRCPRADCECLRDQLLRYIAEQIRVCTVLNVQTDRVRTMEYSGCTRGVLSTYFGTNTKPSREYDALHFRAGDLEGAKGKSFGADELLYILKAMCKTSNRDIVVVTQGVAELPKPSNCGNRLVLASDTTVHDAFQIIQHAKTVAVGTSSFATMMMEVASPTHMVVPVRAAPLYEWVDCEYWTVIGKRGALFHFDSKKMMTETVISGGGVEARSMRTKMQEKWNTFDIEVPPRRWSREWMWGGRENPS